MFSGGSYWGRHGRGTRISTTKMWNDLNRLIKMSEDRINKVFCGVLPRKKSFTTFLRRWICQISTRIICAVMLDPLKRSSYWSLRENGLKIFCESQIYVKIKPESYVRCCLSRSRSSLGAQLRAGRFKNIQGENCELCDLGEVESEFCSVHIMMI